MGKTTLIVLIMLAGFIIATDRVFMTSATFCSSIDLRLFIARFGLEVVLWLGIRNEKTSFSAADCIS